MHTNLKEFIDEELCTYLLGEKLPNVNLSTSNNRKVNFSKLEGLSVIYIYPKTGRADVKTLEGWSDIKGAKGCTPQACSFRDNRSQFDKYNTKIYGLSSQSVDYLEEAVKRLELNFDFVSDENFEFADALSIPRFTLCNTTFLKRVTLLCKNDEIIKVFYPIPSPEKNASDVIKWIKELKNEK